MQKQGRLQYAKKNGGGAFYRVNDVSAIERFQHVITIPYTRNEPPFWCTTCTVCY